MHTCQAYFNFAFSNRMGKTCRQISQVGSRLRRIFFVIVHRLSHLGLLLNIPAAFQSISVFFCLTLSTFRCLYSVWFCYLVYLFPSS